MGRPIQVATFMPFLALSFVSVFSFSPVQGEDDRTGATLALARGQYEDNIQDTRNDVLGKIERKIGSLRARKSKIEEVEVFERAKSAFVESGQWPSLEAIEKCQEKARKAGDALGKALEKAQREYVGAARDDAAKTVKAEGEQFLKESDIVPWRDNLVAGLGGERRTIGAVHQPFELGDLASKNYRIEILAQRLEGGGPLTLAIPVPGKGRLELKTIPGDGKDLRVLLSARGSLISADLGIPRPVPTNFKDDDSPRELVLWADAGKFEVKSVRVKPILAAETREVAQEKSTTKQNPAHGPKKEVDPASRLTKNSNWRGKRWRGKAPGNMEEPQDTTATVTMRDGNQVEIRAPKWAGNQGRVFWTFTIDGDRLIPMSTRFEGGGPTGTFDDVQGSGTVNGDTLRFECSSHLKAPHYNGPVFETLELERSP